MERRDILTLFDREMRIDAPIPGSGFTREQAGPVVRLVGPSASAHDNCVIYSRLDAANADDVIRREIDAFGGRHRSFEWKVFAHDRPPDLRDRLSRHGFVVEGSETMLVRTLAEDEGSSRTAPELLIRRIDRAEGLADVMAVQDAVWDDDHGWLHESLAQEIADMGDDLEILVADAPGAGPVATSWMRLHPGTSFASIWGAATLAPFRGRGIYTALVGRHMATARGRAARLMTVDANENSRPVLERIGFETLVEVYGFVWRPPA